ncbi:MAG: hypothetical protein EOP09_00130 [Proteobacteria bacterium]|nr:MAG: hypothetical protein EOP09_00130 [Pseudomonadota bacterium]
MYREATGRWETSLTGNDNVLLGRQARHYRSSEAWNRCVRTYWQNVVHHLGEELRRSAERQRLPLSYSPNFNLNGAEIYWEVECRDALAEMGRIRPILLAMGRSAIADLYSVISEGRETESPSIKITLAKGIRLKVYAKTNLRIRLEIDYDLKEAALGWSRTSEDPEAIYGWLNHLQIDASRRMESVFLGLRSDLTSCQWDDLIAGVCRAAKTPAEIANVLRQITVNRSFNAYSAGSRGTTIERTLKRYGIIQSNVASGGLPVLSPQFHNTLNFLSNFFPTL